MSVKTDKYDNYRAALLAGRAPEADIDREIENMRTIDAQVDVGVCPIKNESPNARHVLTRTLDPRQSGPTQIAGKWFKYRCTCGWYVDRCEPVGEN